MEVVPVGKYSAPRVPTHDVLERHPELLRVVPKSWRTNPAVLAALTGTLLLMDSCRAVAGTTATQSVSRVAPMFIHGDGRGGYGCVAVAAPLYLTEDEARSIINEEAKKAGIEFKSPGITHQSVEVPVVKGFDDVVERNEKGKLIKPAKLSGMKKASLQMDGTDAKHRVSYEFVSNADFGEMSKDAQMVSTWLSHDILGAAALQRKGLEKAKPAGYTVVFYDPVAWTKYPGEMGPGLLDEPPAPGGGDGLISMDDAREQLRAQVKDFIKWLKGQGVI